MGSFYCNGELICFVSGAANRLLFFVFNNRELLRAKLPGILMETGI